jgi:hypothetical protein
MEENCPAMRPLFYGLVQAVLLMESITLFASRRPSSSEKNVVMISPMIYLWRCYVDLPRWGRNFIAVSPQFLLAGFQFSSDHELWMHAYFAGLPAPVVFVQDLVHSPALDPAVFLASPSSFSYYLHLSLLVILVFHVLKLLIVLVFQMYLWLRCRLVNPRILFKIDKGQGVIHVSFSFGLGHLA